MFPDSLPDSSPHPPPPPRADGAFTAILFPLGGFAGLILLFALWTTDRLIVPGLTHQRTDPGVWFLGFRVGSTDVVPDLGWGLGFLIVFGVLGATLGLAAGKLLDRLTRWGT